MTEAPGPRIATRHHRTPPLLYAGPWLADLFSTFCSHPSPAECFAPSGLHFWLLAWRLHLVPAGDAATGTPDPRRLARPCQTGPSIHSQPSVRRITLTYWAFVTRRPGWPLILLPAVLVIVDRE